MVKVGICGLGFMGRTHFSIYDKLRNAKVVALMDKQPKRRKGEWKDPIGNLPSVWPKQVNMKGVTSYATPEELIGDPDIDLVDVTMPTDLHAEVVIKALKTGKHVISEKPMALTAKDALKVAAVAAKSKGYYMVAQCIRFWPQYVKIKELVDSKKLGAVRSVALRRLADPPMYSSDGWLMDHKRSGGAAFDLHLHDVDFAVYMLGKPRAVYATGTKGPSKGWDHVEAFWDYGRNKKVTIEGGWSFAKGYPFQMMINVRCEKATIEWGFRGAEPSPWGNEVMIYHNTGRVQKVKVKAATGWDEELAYLINCIEKKQTPKVAAAKSSALSVAMVEAEVKSIETGKVIKIA